MYIEFDAVFVPSNSERMTRLCHQAEPRSLSLETGFLVKNLTLLLVPSHSVFSPLNLTTTFRLDYNSINSIQWLMARIQLLSFASLAGLFNLNALYLVGYAWLFGMCEFRPRRCSSSNALTFKNLQLCGYPSSEVCHSVVALKNKRHWCSTLRHNCIQGSS